MRVALINYEDKEIASKLAIKEEYKNCIFFDELEGLDNSSYYIDIRMYDLVFINISNEDKIDKKIFNIFKTLADDYENYQIVLTHNKDISKNKLETLTTAINTIYKKIKPNLSFLELPDREIIGSFSKSIGSYFTSIPLKEVSSINYKERELTITTHMEKEVVIKITKDIDFQVILYFIRHYNQIINIDTILSGISQEPELMNNSPIETSFSSIRKTFSKLNINPIKAFKRVGFQITFSEPVLAKKRTKA